MKYDYMLVSRIFSISEGWLIAERWRTFITVECDNITLTWASGRGLFEKNHREYLRNKLKIKFQMNQIEYL